MIHSSPLMVMVCRAPHGARGLKLGAVRRCAIDADVAPRTGRVG